MPAWLPSSLIPLSLACRLACNGSPFLACPPLPPPIGTNLASKPAIANSPTFSAAGGWDPRNDNLGGQACWHQGLSGCLHVCEGDPCSKPACATRLEVGRVG